MLHSVLGLDGFGTDPGTKTILGAYWTACCASGSHHWFTSEHVPSPEIEPFRGEARLHLQDGRERNVGALHRIHASCSNLQLEANSSAMIWFVLHHFASFAEADLQLRLMTFKFNWNSVDSTDCAVCQQKEMEPRTGQRHPLYCNAVQHQRSIFNAILSVNMFLWYQDC